MLTEQELEALIEKKVEAALDRRLGVPRQRPSAAERITVEPGQPHPQAALLKREPFQVDWPEELDTITREDLYD